MPPDDFTTSREFVAAVRMLRALGPRYALMAVYAAGYWDEERLAAAERDGDVPGNNGALLSGPHLRIVQ